MSNGITLQRSVLGEFYPTLLAIESSGETCGVALAVGGECLAASDSKARDHSAVLTHLIEMVLREAKIAAKALQAIVLSEGPGSYTSLRIGFATAKGMAYAVGCPIIAVPTLESLASAMTLRRPKNREQAALLPMIDARRMEVYTQPYTAALAPLAPPAARIFDEPTRAFFAGYGSALFGGSGAAKGREYLEPLGYCFLPDVQLTAEALLPLALQRYRRRAFASVAYLEPLYLKEFVALPSKKPF